MAPAPDVLALPLARVIDLDLALDLLTSGAINEELRLRLAPYRRHEDSSRSHRRGSPHRAIVGAPPPPKATEIVQLFWFPPHLPIDPPTQSPRAHLVGSAYFQDPTEGSVDKTAQFRSRRHDLPADKSADLQAPPRPSHHTIALAPLQQDRDEYDKRRDSATSMSLISAEMLLQMSTISPRLLPLTPLDPLGTFLRWQKLPRHTKGIRQSR
ncbi:hypothetical protein H4Q26_014137 [Puccinia striiformis f. sp. tritici PST-130]|nr:hypothetical protein H4Q26_014137 [Puccinia striiformis f. sp. tritici PST-130]